jgi:hypothetical protein
MTAPGGDLLAWLDNAISRRESAAKSASPGPWVPGGIGDYGWTVHTGVRSVETEDSELGQADAKHIALNSPSATLRRCAADRKLLELHQPVADHGRYSEPQCPIECDGQHSGPSVCASCRDYVGDPVEAPCPTVLLIAEGYGWTGGKR